MSVSDANLIGVVKFYDGLCGRRSAKLDRRVNSLIRSAVNDTVLTSTATDRQITQRVMETDRQTDRRTDVGRAGRPSVPSVQGRSVSIIDYNRQLF